jgi:hypothetical protein
VSNRGECERLLRIHNCVHNPLIRVASSLALSLAAAPSTARRVAQARQQLRSALAWQAALLCHPDVQLTVDHRSVSLTPVAQAQASRSLAGAIFAPWPNSRRPPR